ncbi:MAG TPA: hypothetical protein DCZ92_04840 [Elusimicrobia bacterium]|nr:MAG: hypothetical protein A2016_03520 [Elusimicrobia bacterium GWF2_62_30]HBA60135.1 hypothetical protein [Elusimicrobiota bacterium]
MKRNLIILAIAVLTLGNSPRLQAQTAALDSLKSSLSVELEIAVPPSSQPVPFKASAPAPSLSGEQLFTYLHDITAPGPDKGEPSYKASKAFMYSKADNTGCNGGPGIVTFYSQVCVKGSSSDGNSYKETGDMNADGSSGDFINAEHIWPQGYFKSALPMVADLHHLAPTFSVPNGRRANYKFARVANYVYSTSAGSKLGSNAFEPTSAVKGNVARALFYFIVRYHDRNISQGMNYTEFWKNNVPMLLEWNRQDPPDAAELRRNDQVESFQGNRNPFIDDHTLAERVGLETFMAH